MNNIDMFLIGMFAGILIGTIMTTFIMLIVQINNEEGE